jgi:predicted dienelactone hydrolase
VRPRASADAPFAREIAAAPVLVFSTGRSMAAHDYTSLAEDLASHGYVVVGVESPQLSRFVLPGGEPIPPLPPPPLEVLQRFDRADAFFEPMIDLVAEDLRYVRQRLSDLDGGDPILEGHLSLDAIGMMGHSNGALAGSRACARQPECRAFLGIEGTQAREVRKQGIDKPYALLISEQSLGYDKENV